MKSLKPIATDVHFKYRCPNAECGAYHWLSLKETQTKNFKVVCDCSSVFKPKQIQLFKIKYANHPKQIVPKTQPEPKSEDTIDHNLEQNCIKLLLNNGFTEDEAKKLVNRAYSISLIADKISLVKYILANIGDLENYDKKTSIVR